MWDRIDSNMPPRKCPYIKNRLNYVIDINYIQTVTLSQRKNQGNELNMYCYYMRFKLVDSEVLVKDFYNHTKNLKSDEKANKTKRTRDSRREKSKKEH